MLILVLLNLDGSAYAGGAQSAQGTKDPAIKEVLPAGTLEAFASNRKLREQLEQVRSTVAQAKAQVDAAGSTFKAQVPPGCPWLSHGYSRGTRICQPNPHPSKAFLVSVPVHCQ